MYIIFVADEYIIIYIYIIYIYIFLSGPAKTL